jgi:hypothetical protein
MRVDEKAVVSFLRVSGERVGRLYPVLVDKYGNVIDGLHRLAADEEWPKVTVEGVETEEQRLIARLVSNVCRRDVPASEKRNLLGRLGEIHLRKGVELGKIAYKIAEETGMSYSWVMKYLPDKFKESSQAQKGRASATSRLTHQPLTFRVSPHNLEDPPKGAVAVKAYGNTSFVSIMLEKNLYKELEETARKLRTTPAKLLYNAIRIIIKQALAQTLQPL